MKFSVIIPAHNEEDEIRKPLDSIRAQSFTDYEVIVVCDDCKDKTKQIAEEYGAKVLEINAHSSGAARNAALEVAQGEWVLFCDADDWYLHEFAFAQLNEKLNEKPCDLLMFALIWKNMGYGTIRSPHGTVYTHVANKCWRRAAIGNTRFPDQKSGVAEDAVFYERMTDKGLRIVEWDMPLYYYNYLRPGSKSALLGRTAEKSKAYWSTH